MTVKVKGDPGKEFNQKWLVQFDMYLEQNLNTPMLNVSNLARDYNMSTATFLRKFKQLTGMPPAQYLIDFKLKKGKKLLMSQKYSVAKVAAKVGYKDYRSFSRAFKAKYSIHPSDLVGE